MDFMACFYSDTCGYDVCIEDVSAVVGVVVIGVGVEVGFMMHTRKNPGQLSLKICLTLLW